jgi:hypothetical protein
MSLDDWHLVFVSVCLVLVLGACAPVAMAYLPRRGEPFMALAVLGEEGMAEKYYPGDDPSIGVGEEVHWTLYLYNHMGEVRYVAVRVKLLNSTMSSPNSTSCSPSPAPVVYEVRRILLDNETWLYPLDWSLTDVGGDGGLVSIEGLMMNGEAFQTDAESVHGYNFRVVLELWTYDEASEGFIFGWASGEESHCVWNQIWFNATLPK